MTDDRVLSSPDWIARARGVLEAGAGELALHLRGPTTGPRRLLELVDLLSPVAEEVGSALLVNDRVDVALVTDLDGVHLGGGSLPPRPARTILGPERWIGVSCHDSEEVEAAVEGGADYVFMGTLFPTETHPEREGVGVAGLEEAIASARGVPTVGIGGIGPEDVGVVIGAGAYGVAAIRGIWSAPDPSTAVTEYLERLAD